MEKPEIRFEGFTDPWEQRKLEGICSEIIAGGDVDKTQLKSEGHYPVVANALKGDGIIGYYDSYYRITPPAITITGRGEVGHAKARFCPFTPVVRLLTIKTPHDPVFIENAINNLKVIVESTGVPQLTVPQLSKYEFYVPCLLQEEQLIGHYFQQLDNLITLHQRKYDKLVILKKALLEKMFPKDGASVPEIRFEGFTDPWEQRKLDDVADRFDNVRVPVTAKDRIPGSTPYYGANGIQDYVQGYTHEGEYVLVAEDGATNLNDYPVQLINGLSWVNNHAHVIQARGNLADNTYLMYSIKNCDIASVLVGGTRAKLNAEVLMNLKLAMPDLREQRQIGTFFQQLDNLITLHQRELELLKHLKSALLDRCYI